MGVFVLLLGFPGVGKLTIAKELGSIGDDNLTVGDCRRRRQAGFASAGGYVKHAQAVGEIGAPKHGVAKRGEPTENQAVPFLPAGGKFVPRLTLLVTDIVEIC